MATRMDPTEKTESPEAKKEPAPDRAAELAALEAKLAEAATRFEAMQAKMAELEAKTAPPPTPEPKPDPALDAMVDRVVAKLAPHFNALGSQVMAQRQWTSNQQLRETARSLGVPEDVQAETEALMARYAEKGQPLDVEIALANQLGMREIKRRQAEQMEVQKRAKLNGGLATMSFMPGGYHPAPVVDGPPPLPADASIQEILEHGRKHFRS